MGSCLLPDIICSSIKYTFLSFVYRTHLPYANVMLSIFILCSKWFWYYITALVDGISDMSCDWNQTTNINVTAYCDMSFPVFTPANKHPSAIADLPSIRSMHPNRFTDQMATLNLKRKCDIYWITNSWHASFGCCSCQLSYEIAICSVCVCVGDCKNWVISGDDEQCWLLRYGLDQVFVCSTCICIISVTDNSDKTGELFLFHVLFRTPTQTKPSTTSLPTSQLSSKVKFGTIWPNFIFTQR